MRLARSDVGRSQSVTPKGAGGSARGRFRVKAGLRPGADSRARAQPAAREDVKSARCHRWASLAAITRIARHRGSARSTGERPDAELRSRPSESAAGQPAAKSGATKSGAAKSVAARSVAARSVASQPGASADAAGNAATRDTVGDPPAGSGADAGAGARWCSAHGAPRGPSTVSLNVGCRARID